MSQVANIEVIYMILDDRSARSRSSFGDGRDQHLSHMVYILWRVPVRMLCVLDLPCWHSQPSVRACLDCIGEKGQDTFRFESVPIVKLAYLSPGHTPPH